MFKPVQCYLLARQVLDLVADRPSKSVLIFYENLKSFMPLFVRISLRQITRY